MYFTNISIVSDLPDRENPFEASFEQFLDVPEYCQTKYIHIKP